MLDAAVLVVQIVLALLLIWGAVLVLGQLYADSSRPRVSRKPTLHVVEGGASSNAPGEKAQSSEAPQEQPKIAA
jgi:hypothetical protein